MLNEDFINIFTYLTEGYEQDRQSQALLGYSQLKDKRLADTRCNKGLVRKKNTPTMCTVEHYNKVT